MRTCFRNVLCKAKVNHEVLGLLKDSSVTFKSGRKQKKCENGEEIKKYQQAAFL